MELYKKVIEKETVKQIILWTQNALHYGKITGSDDEIAERCMKEIEEEADQGLPSDEDIEAYFTSHHFDNKNGHHYRINRDRIFGAKAMRDNKIGKQ